MTALDLEGNRVAVCTATALVLHACVGAAIFLGAGVSHSSIPSPAAQMVVELADLPTAPAVPPSPSPPETEKHKAQPQPVEQKLDLPPPPRMELNVHPEIAVPVQEPRKQEVERRDKSADETTKAAAPPAPQADAARAPSVGAPAKGTTKAEQSWESRVLATLERKKHYPDAAQQQGQQDVVLVRITLDSGGRLIDSQIRRSQGYVLLDKEVAALVRRASPFPTPPADVMAGKANVTLLVPVEFLLDKSRAARKSS